MKKLLLPSFSFACLFLAVLMIDSLLVQQGHYAHLDSAKTRLNELTNRLSSVVAQRLQLTEGLAAFVKSRSSFDQREFNLFADSAGAHSPGILALQLAPDAVVKYTTDMVRNGGAIGHDLLADPERRPQVERAIAERKMVVTGPVSLLQGGRAIIARNPIYIESANSDYFWGFATVLLDVGQLFLDAGLTRHDDDIQIAVRGVNGRGARGEVFFGDPEVFELDPVVANVSLPGGAWQVGAALVMHDDWSLQRQLVWCVFGVIAPLVFWLLYRLQREPETLKVRIGEATRELQKAYSQAETASKAKSNFLANMSHELRTPLNAIMGFNSLIADNSRDAESRAHAIQALAASRHLLALVNDILDITRIEEVGTEINIEPFNVRELVGVVESNLTALIGTKPVLVERQLADDIPLWLDGDELRLTQILMNFASNAAKFTEQGAITIKVDLLAINAAVAKLAFRIVDTGRGIPADKLKAVFDKFQQVDSSDTRQHGGTGLGLAICQSLLDAMDGKLIVESREGEGSCFGFEIELPVAVAPARLQRADSVQTAGEFSVGAAAGEEVLADSAEVAGNVMRPLERIKILVVDDNAVNQKVAYEILIRQGAEVHCVGNGQEAIDFLVVDRQFVDIVLMDVRMPVMGGLEATEALRKDYHYEGAVVGLSANTSEEDIRASLDAGMNDHICKPFKKDELVSVIRNQLGYLA